MTLTRYTLVDTDDLVKEGEYDSWPHVLEHAKMLGYAIVANHYEYSDSELVWTPDGSTTWPPVKEHDGRCGTEACPVCG